MRAMNCSVLSSKIGYYYKHPPPTVSHKTDLIYIVETLAEGRSKVKDAKANQVPVVEKEFLAGVKTEGVVSMIKQHTISEWGQGVEEKIQKARAVSEAGSLKSGGEFVILCIFKIRTELSVTCCAM